MNAITENETVAVPRCHVCEGPTVFFTEARGWECMDITCKSLAGAETPADFPDMDEETPAPVHPPAGHSTLSNRNESIQDVGTDKLFFSVVHREFSFAADLAANEHNHKCPVWYGKSEGDTETAGGSLNLPWHRLAGWLWLNPPYKDMEPWARKCQEEAALGAKIAMLVPASVDTDWFEDYVWGKAEVRFLKSRLTFDFIHVKGPNAGKQNVDNYPKPLMLVLFERGRFPTAAPWNWKGNLPKRLPAKARIMPVPLLDTPVVVRKPRKPLHVEAV